MDQQVNNSQSIIPGPLWLKALISTGFAGFICAGAWFMLGQIVVQNHNDRLDDRRDFHDTIRQLQDNYTLQIKDIKDDAARQVTIIKAEADRHTGEIKGAVDKNTDVLKENNSNMLELIKQLKSLKPGG